ncbi:glutathione S-transferase [Novosphingobium kunmingense]|uniref:Glutathione S-transferase n=1 Tax=Novosphingobium kunmingense TaxID=1211806 RepID=A0A2N0I3R1_9SPHN|nr:glutathione S-transferase family protein [Novosphingobium kunmingense]PKB25810.1 glutathione S-transferase [Novosphingobium kunmingense]
MLILYGHPFSSYTWKALIALYANGTPFEFRELGKDNADDDSFVAAASPSGQFPVLRDGEATVFEATAIIEHLHCHHPSQASLLPTDPAEAARVRMWDRVFDLHVMNAMQQAVAMKLRDPVISAEAARDAVRARLIRSYHWIEDWLGTYRPVSTITLVECAAAPSLFYADWVIDIPDDCARLKAWREHLLALPPVARCVDDARPYRAYFPLGAPDRD